MLNKDTSPTEKQYIFTQETIDSLMELGEALKKIHLRMLSEGYVFENNQFIRPHDNQNKK